MFETPLEKVVEQFILLKREAAKIGDGIDMYLGCEFHSNMEMARLLREGTIASMAGSRYVLVEFSGSAEENYIRERLYSLISSGYKPIIAHIERVEVLRKDMGVVEALSDMGARMQVNADSIIGKEGFGTKRFCSKLMKADLLDFVGSDCHGSSYRISRIGEAYDTVAKKFGDTYANRIFIKNPQKIIGQEG
jgi:protein-tyrosine phosphatase